MIIISAAVLCLTIVSCSDRTSSRSRIQGVLSAADSLMMTDPQAALDTLLVIDSAEISGLMECDRAYWALLKTEARYKCYLPVDKDTSIFESAVYYDRRGVDDRLARSLIMAGAVLSEQGITDRAMKVYKDAEQILKKSGDLEQQGLLHTRIGELYQNSVVHSEEAVFRYRKALECFGEAGLEEREAFAHISLGMLLIENDKDSAEMHLSKSLELARETGSRLCGITAYRSRVYMYKHYGDDSSVIGSARAMFSEYGVSPSNDAECEIYNGVTMSAAKSYMNQGILDSALLLAGRIFPRSVEDSLLLLSLRSELSVAVQDWESAYVNNASAGRIAGELMRRNYENHLQEVERRYDNEVLKNNLQAVRLKGTVLAVVLLMLLLCVTALYFFFKARMRSKDLTYAKALGDVRAMQVELYRVKEESAALVSRVHAGQQEADMLRNELKKVKRLSEDEEDVRQLRRALLCQVSSNMELLSLNGELLGIMENLANICYVYEGSSKISEKVGGALKNIISESSVYPRVEKMLDAAFPGFMDGIVNDYPWLDDNERKLITLMCCGFTTVTVSIMMRSDVSSLNSKKYRLARKMGISGRLSTYLKKRQQEYAANSGSVTL